MRKAIYRIDPINRWVSIVLLSIGVPFFILTVDEVLPNILLLKVLVGLFGFWAVLDLFLRRVEFTEDDVSVFGALGTLRLSNATIFKITVLNFEKYPLIPFYFRIYYKNENDECFIDIRVRRYGTSAFKILEEFKKREFKITLIEEL